jgi:hypothetical protein
MIVLAQRNSPIPYAAASSLLKDSLDQLRSKSSSARTIVDFVGQSPDSGTCNERGWRVWPPQRRVRL